MSRALRPGRWSRDGRTVADNQACELDNVLPLRPEFPPTGHQPVYQRPARRDRSGRHLVVAVVALALIAAGTLVLLAPIQTTNAVAHWVGPR